jgi:broad specificity phosphatase PhoE
VPPTSPTTTRLVLVRHGAVAEPWGTRIYGRLEVPLSAEGEAEARRVALALGKLRLDGVVCSGLARAEFSAALLREGRDLERRDDPRFLEMDRGTWAGLEQAHLAAEFPGDWAAFCAAGGAWQAPGAEPLDGIRARVRAGLDDWAEVWPGGQVAVVAHMWVLRAAVITALELAPEAMGRVWLPTSGVVVLDWPTVAGRRQGLGPRLLASVPDELPSQLGG